MSMWFIGIIFKKVENAESVNIDLTYDIQSFTDTGRSHHSAGNTLVTTFKIKCVYYWIICYRYMTRLMGELIYFNCMQEVQGFQAQLVTFCMQEVQVFQAQLVTF